MDYTRRDLSLLLPALAAATTTAQAQNKSLPAQVWVYEDLPVKKNGVNESRQVFNGETHSGYPIELHMTKLAEGQLSHPPHHHPNEEVLMLRTGQLEANFAGKVSRITAGSTVYMASNLEHNWKNPGPGPAEYFVIALGDKKA